MKSLFLPAVACFVLASLVGCAGESGPSSGIESGSETADAYSTRGVVRALPDPAKPGSELQIRHEELPDFKSMDGEVVGMKSMTMPFPIEPSLLEGVEVGDRVAFDFEVRWEGSPPMRVTRLEVLPAGTLLDFETPEDLATQEPVLEAPVESPAESH